MPPVIDPQKIQDKTSSIVKEYGLHMINTNQEEYRKKMSHVIYTMVQQQMEAAAEIGRQQKVINNMKKYYDLGCTLRDLGDDDQLMYKTSLEALRAPLTNYENIIRLIFILLKATATHVTGKSDIEIISGESGKAKKEEKPKNEKGKEDTSPAGDGGDDQPVGAGKSGPKSKRDK